MPEATEIDTQLRFEVAEMETQVNHLRNQLHLVLRAMDGVQYQLGRLKKEIKLDG